MRRTMKKGISFCLAVTLLFTSVQSPVWAKEEKTQSAVSVLADTVYDEAVTFSENIAFLENGNWSDGGEVWEYLPENHKTNVTKDTNIVLLDANGNKTKISNTAANGDTLFDAIYPMISDAYAYDMFRVVKNNKVSYIKADGSYYGKNLNYYHYAVPISQEFLFATEDGQNYMILNSNGGVILNGIPSDSRIKMIGNSLYVNDKAGNEYVYDCTGKLIHKYAVNSNYASSAVGNNYASVKTADKTLLLDADAKLVYECNNNDAIIDATNTDYGTISVRTYENRKFQTSIIDINTKKILSSQRTVDRIYGNVVLGMDDQMKTVLTATDGTVFISDLHETALKLGEQEGYKSVSYGFTYVNGSLLIFMADAEDDEKCNTFVLAEENKFDVTKSTKLDGYLLSTSYDEEYLITGSYDGYISNLATTKGSLIKDYKRDTTYQLPGAIAKRNYHNGLKASDEIEGFAFTVGVYDSGKRKGTTYIREDGTIGNTYISWKCGTSGNFYVGERIGGGYEVVGTDNKLVYSGSADSIYGFWNVDCFVVEKDGKEYLYNKNGAQVIGDESSYSSIGTSVRRGCYWANADDTNRACFGYYNDACLNGLCVVSRKIDGKEKYGAVLLGNLLSLKNTNGLHLGADGKWYYYKNGSIDTSYTGLCQYDGAWYYVQKGVLNWNYTGLCKYGSDWYYVQKGVLKWGETTLVSHNGTWYYVSNSRVNFNYTGLCKYGSNWYYIQKGVLKWGQNTLVKYNGTWWYVKNSIVDFGYTGLANYNGGWYYVSKGAVNFNYTGLCKYGSNWYYVQKGNLKWGANTLVNYNGTWWCVNNSIVNFKYTGLVQYNGTWWYVNKGAVNFKYTGLCKYGNSWYYVQNGALKWGANTLVKYNGGWYYVKNSVVDFKYNGTVKYNGSNFNVLNGKVKF